MDKKTKHRDELAAEEAPATERMLAPIEWAKELGLSRKHGRGPEARTLLSAEYMTASSHYGWHAQAHHWGKDSLLLTKEDFLAAMAASEQYPTVRLHEPAIAPVVAEKRAGFRPFKAHKD